MATEPNAVTMNVSLPPPLKNYVDGKVSSGTYSSASEFVREVLRERFERDREQQAARERLTSQLLEGVNSGRPTTILKGHFKRKKKALVRRLRHAGKRA